MWDLGMLTAHAPPAERCMSDHDLPLLCGMMAHCGALCTIPGRRSIERSPQYYYYYCTHFVHTLLIMWTRDRPGWKMIARITGLFGQHDSFIRSKVTERAGAKYCSNSALTFILETRPILSLLRAYQLYQVNSNTRLLYSELWNPR